MLIESLCKYVFHVFSINLKEKKEIKKSPHIIFMLPTRMLDSIELSD